MTHLTGSTGDALQVIPKQNQHPLATWQRLEFCDEAQDLKLKRASRGPQPQENGGDYMFVVPN